MFTLIKADLRPVFGVEREEACEIGEIEPNDRQTGHLIGQPEVGEADPMERSGKASVHIVIVTNKLESVSSSAYRTKYRINHNRLLSTIMHFGRDIGMNV